MKITVSSIQSKNDLTVIYCITEKGMIKGIWKSDEAPVLLKKYFAELSYIEFDKQITADNEKNICSKLQNNDNIVCFHGLCEDMDDEVYYIRFADDWLDMIEIPNKNTAIHKGDHIFFSASYEKILIYPYD